MTLTQPQASATAREAEPVPAKRARWALAGTAAGVLGFVATMPLDGRHVADHVSGTDGLFAGLSPIVYHLSMVFGYLAVAMLLVTAAAWRRHVEPRLSASTAAHLVPLGLLASAAGLTYGYGWKGALGNYLPGSLEPDAYDTNGLYVYYLLNDFGSFIGWLGVVVAAGAVAWMGLRERTVSRWIGAVSVLPVLGVTFLGLVMGVPGVPGLFAPAWLVITFTALAFGRSTISR